LKVVVTVLSLSLSVHPEDCENVTGAALGTDKARGGWVRLKLSPQSQDLHTGASAEMAQPASDSVANGL
jgi:hypothetical protein